MAGFGKDKKNPGPKDKQFTTQENVQRPRGTVPGSKSSVGTDEQFNKGKSYDGDDGSSRPATLASKGSKISGVGSSGMQDEQFDDHLAKSGKGGKLGGKSSGGTPGSFNGGSPSPAAQIMRAIASASQEAEQHPTEYQGSKKVSSAKSANQSKSYKDTTPDNLQARPKSQITQKISKK